MDRSLLLLITLMVCCSGVSDASAQQDDDLLLLALPAIIQAAKNNAQTTTPPPPTQENPALTKIKELTGRWSFNYLAGDLLDNEFYRFDGKTATGSNDPNIFFIFGDSSIDSTFITEWCVGGLSAAYFVGSDDYIVLCDWGFPVEDIGSIFSFDTVSDTFTLEHVFYVPSTNEILDAPTPGSATRISSVFKSSTETKIDSSAGKIRHTDKADLKTKLLAEYLRQDHSEGDVIPKSVKHEQTQLQQKIQRMLELQR